MVGLGVALGISTGDIVGGVWLAFIGWSSWRARRGRRRSRRDFSGRIEHIRVADVMDAEPVAIAESAPLSEAEHTFFLRYGWPWFPVVDAIGQARGRRVKGGGRERARRGARRRGRSDP